MNRLEEATVPMSLRKNTIVGVLLAAAVLGTWLLLHVWAVFFFRLAPNRALGALLLIALQTWLSCGLFIIAHDAMHGSLAPQLPRVNTFLGRISLIVYAFFPYDRVAVKHHSHHRYAGTDGDPDFLADRPRVFWAWYLNFFRQYFSWYQLGAIFLTVVLYVLVLHAQLSNVLLFWALPSILSSVQLFTFGTWLPHRQTDKMFFDRHNARTIELRWLPSLITCYHFGYHIEHHQSPGTPWWGLPRVRAQRLPVRGNA